jgi:PAS domain S-box-containing protein
MRQRGGSEQPGTGRHANRARKSSIAAPSIADLQNQVGTLARELKEAREQQTATAEVLKVINSSPGNLTPVFESMLERAHALCGVAYGSLQLYDGAMFRAVAVHGLPEALASRLREGYVPPGDSARPLIEGADFVHFPDMAERAVDDPRARTVVDAGIRTLLWVPLRKDGKLLGRISAARQEVRPFSDKEIALLQGFAAQAVIAMENARLLEELRQRQAELARSVDELTAITDVLKIISRSPSHLQPVLDTIATCAVSLCGASMGAVYRFDGELVHLAAHHNYPLEALSHLQKMYPRPPRTDQVSGRAILTRAVSQIEDSQLDPLYRRELAIAGGWRSQLAVPMLRDGEPYGAIVIARSEAGRFSDAPIEVLKTFADQAVIAIENTRLFEEVRDRQAELRVTFDNMGDGVAMFDAEPRLAAWNRNFEQIIGLPEALLAERPSYADYLRMLAERGEFGTENVEAALASRLENMDRELRLERTRADGTVIEVRRNAVPGGGFVLIYSDVTEQRRAEAAIRAARDAAEAALERQTATADILKVIASSPTDVQPVLDAVAKAAQRFCGAVDAVISLREDDEIIRAAHQGSLNSVMGRSPVDLSSITGRTIINARTVHIPDIATLDRDELATTQALAADSGARAAAAAPLLREGIAVGCILLRKREPGPFAPDQIELLESFAAQAVIAIENVRLFSELKESLEQQTATADVLRVINTSPGELAPVFAAMLEKAMHLCEAAFGTLWVRDGDHMATVGVPPAYQDFLDKHPISYGQNWGAKGTIPNRIMAGAPEIHVEDLAAETPYVEGDLHRRAMVDIGGARSALAVPLVKDGAAIGYILIYRQEVRRFDDKQATLLKNFAAQAVIAVENARLLGELRESLDQQTATAEVLQVINSSTQKLEPVFEAMLEKALRLCEAAFGVLWTYDGENFNASAMRGIPEAFAKFVAGVPHKPGPENIHGIMLRGESVVRVDDLRSSEVYRSGDPVRRALVDLGGASSALGIALRKDDTLLGVFVIYWQQPHVIADKQVTLLQNFAEQAVIAIENVRLFTELRESLEQQTATAEILTVISQSPTEVGPVLSAVTRSAMKFCGANDAVVSLRDGDEWVIAAHEGPIETLIGRRYVLTRHTTPGRAMTDGEVVQIADLQSDEGDQFPEGREIGIRLSFRSALAAPLLRDDVSIGAISLRRREAGEFEPRQVELLKTFAAQAVIAIENVRLFTELHESLERLKAAQANLIQAEKMASLGQLTAGIAHEIKNPLNFVNNFAGLSVELLEELRQAAAPVLDGMSEDARAEFGETVDLITANLEKIAEHGKRADGIVKSMLAHSRGGTGDWQASNINALVEEALNLAYHGARAQDKDFNVTLERDFAETAPIEVVPQDVTRVFLNLFGNGFYAAKKRQLGGTGSGYRPTLTVSTRDLGEAVEIRVRDNGTGISPEVRARLFQPFFTTKPTGEGTGLGLSISYDIVTQQHGGSIEVESEPGSFTEFTVRLPRRRRAA